MMGRMWLGCCFLGFCFMLGMFNSSAFCDTDCVTNLETKRVVKNAENSLRVEKGIGCVKQSNARLPIQSTKPMGLNDGEVHVGRRALNENVTRTDTGDGVANAPKNRKRVGIGRKERASFKQSVQKNVNGVQNYSTTKEEQWRRTNRRGDLFKKQEKRSKISRAQSSFNKRKEESSNNAVVENGMNLNETVEESQGDKLRTRIKGKRRVTNLTRKKEEEEEESPNSSIEVNKEEKNDGIIDEDYKNKGLQYEIKGKRSEFKSIPKVEREEEEEDQSSSITENKEKNGGAHDEEEYKKKGLQNKVKNKRSVSKSISKDEREEKDENGNGAIGESYEKRSDGDTEESYNRKGLQSKVKRKRRVSKSMEKDEKQEEGEDTNAIIQDNKEKDSGEYSEQEYKRKGLKNRIDAKGSISISVQKDEKEEEEEDPTASKESKSSDQHSEEEYRKTGMHNEVNRERRIPKLTQKEVKQNEYPNDLMPKSTEKKDIQGSNEESNKNELQSEVKEYNSVLQSVDTYEKTVNDDGFELAEEILGPRDQSASESLDNTKDDGKSIKSKSGENQDPKADQAQWDVAISDKQNKRRIRKGNAIATQMPQESSEDESTEGEIKDDEIDSREKSKFSQPEEDDKEGSPIFDSKGDNEFDEDPIDKQSKSNIRVSEETEVEYADDDMKKESKSKTVPTKKQSKSIFQNPEEENADEFEDNDVKEQNRFRRVRTKKQSTSDFLNSEEENVDESVDNDAIVDNESETVPNNKQSRSNLSNPEEETADESTVIDDKEDSEFETVPTKKKSKSHLPNTEEDNADEMDLKEGDKSKTVSDQRLSQSKLSTQEDTNEDESIKDESKEDAYSETISNNKQASILDTNESSSNSTEEEFSDFIQEFSDLPSKFQDTAEKVADKLIPEIQKFSNKSKVYFNRANEGITQGFRPLIGNKYAPFFASLISYIFVLVPLIVVIVLFDQIRTYFPLQKAILYANIYLAAYFATLILANFLIGMEPMAFFFRNSSSGYTYLQLLEALGYLLYLFLQMMNLIMSFSKFPFSAKLAGILQCGVSVFIGLHYYVTVFHKAMAQKAPRTSWKTYGVYTLAFCVLCLFSKIKHGTKYTQVQDSSGVSKKH